jgi:beta-aspartyl-peptidase (threonine type)
LVHGGAGDAPVEQIPERIAACERAVAAGAAVLAAGGSALDAVQRAVEVLEDEPLLNAGTGACLNIDGGIELDASIMDGETLRAGAVAALPPFRHPVAIARRVMEATRHVLLAGEGAARFAIEHGFAPADLASMITPFARARWEATKRPSTSGGTVGAVARDQRGALAAATSTGGMLNKLAGRVGDSPIIGAGTYADNLLAACSTTGHGEAMMRVCLAKTIVDGARSLDAQATARSGLAMMRARTNETAGAIVALPNGSLGLARTTNTMIWAAVIDGTPQSGS